MRWLVNFCESVVALRARSTASLSADSACSFASEICAAGKFIPD